MEPPNTPAGSRGGPSRGRSREVEDHADDRLVPAAELLDLAVAILAGAGAPPSNARAVAHSLVESNLVGHDSHGVRRLTSYIDAVRAGRIDPEAEPCAEARRRATTVVHGRQAFGQLAARLATEELARTSVDCGVATAVITNCNHVGRLGEYVGALAGRGLIAMALCNADPTVAPYGGSERRMGTNPLAWAFPRASGAPPVVMDWATSTVAEGKLAVALARGETVPPQLLLDPEGLPSVSPEDFYRGGSLLPFGGHKGYGLSVVIDAVGGLLSGAGISCLPGYNDTNGTVLVAFDIAALLPVEYFVEQVEEFCRTLKSTPPAQGHEEVLVPGETEERAREQRSAGGIPVPERTWRELHHLADPTGAGTADASD